MGFWKVYRPLHTTGALFTSLPLATSKALETSRVHTHTHRLPNAASGKYIAALVAPGSNVTHGAHAEPVANGIQ